MDLVKEVINNWKDHGKVIQIMPNYFDNRGMKIFRLNNSMRIFIVSDKDASLSAISLEINYGGLGIFDNYNRYSQKIKSNIQRFPYFNAYDNLPGMPTLLWDTIYEGHKFQSLEKLITKYSGS